MAHLQYPNGTMIRRDYTARGQLERVWDSLGQQPVRYYYHKDGKVEHQDHPNGTTTAFGYDGRGMISSVHHKRTANGANLSYRDYWRDDRDRIKAWKKSSDSIVNPMENGRGDRYSYDEAGQLTTARYQAADPQGNATTPERGDDFVYDALGNRKGANNWVASHGAMNFTIKENGLNQYSGWWPYNFVKYDDDIGGDWGTPGHANGVLMQEGWITAGFNALNQPTGIMSRAYNGTSDWMWFGFDPLGRCVKRWVTYPGGPDTGATYYYYEGWNLLQEGASPASVQRLYIHGARVDEIIKSINYTSTTSQTAWHHYDGRGHCTMLTGPNGEILEQYDYDAFGFPYFYDGQGNAKTFFDTPSNSARGYSPHGNRFLFTGREWLTDLKLYDYRNRMYHPELGRFLQPDPMHFAAGDYNLYRYCHNDPINKTDPDGLYGKGDGWKEKQWKMFDAAQKSAATALEKASAKMDPKVFEKVFGKGSATPEKMAKVQKTMQSMAAALRDDGSKGFMAHATHAWAIHARGMPENTLGHAPVNGTSMRINVEHSGFGNASTLSWTVGHESGHNAGLFDVNVNGISAYKHRTDVYKALTPAQALRNADNYMDFANQ